MLSWQCATIAFRDVRNEKLLIMGFAAFLYTSNGSGKEARSSNVIDMRTLLDGYFRVCHTSLQSLAEHRAELRVVLIRTQAHVNRCGITSFPLSHATVPAWFCTLRIKI